MLWLLIDRDLPEPIPEHTTSRLQAMAYERLVTRHDGHWRPTDAVIEALELRGWDTLELVRFANSGQRGP